VIGKFEGWIYSYEYGRFSVYYVSEIKYKEEYCRDLILVGKEGDKYDKDKYKYGLIDEKGREILRTEFDWVVPYKDLILVRKGDKWGIFDIKGKTVTEVLRTEFDEVAPYDDLILAIKGDKWGIFDLKGKTLLPIKYDWISFEDIKEGREFVRIKENYEVGLADRKGNIVIPPKYDDIKIVIGNNVVFQIEAYFGIADINGREILPAEYEDFSVFNENLFLMSKDLKWGLFDTEKSKFVLPVKYDKINYDENMGLFFVERDGKEFYVKVFSDGKVIEYFDP
jgi:KWG Leptospira.